jgi:hypothetical protein
MADEVLAGPGVDSGDRVRGGDERRTRRRREETVTMAQYLPSGCRDNDYDLDFESPAEASAACERPIEVRPTHA